MSKWPKIALGDCIESIRAGFSAPGESRLPGEDEVGILTLGAVSTGRFDPNECKAVPRSLAPSLGPPVRRGTLLMSRSNTIDLVGMAVLVEEDHPNRFLPDLLWEIVVRPDSPLSIAFLADYLQSDVGRRLLQMAAMGTSSSMKKLSMRRLRRLKVDVPPYELQKYWIDLGQRINLVANYSDRLIAAKREFKRGLMQELLTGRRRFPEFGPKAATIDQPPAGWTETTLGELADIRVSNVDKHTRAEHNSVRLCNYMDVWTRPYIMADQEFMTSTASPREIERFSLRTGDVLLTKDSETREEIAESSVVLSAGADLVLGYHLALVRPNPELVDGRFLAAQLRVPRFRQHFVRSAQGATRYGLTIAALKRAPVWIPPIEEQRRISETDLSLHREIELLEELRTQFETQKRGLLQKLLTGELTIPVPETTDQEPVHA